MSAAVLAACLAVIPQVEAHAESVSSRVADDGARGVELRRQGRAAAAIPLLQQAAVAHPNDADILLNLGLAYGEADRIDEAEATLDRALRLTPDYVDVQIARARVAFFRSDFAEAQRRIIPVVAAHPENVEAQALARQVQAAIRDSGAGWRLDAAYTAGRLGHALPDATSSVLALTRQFGGRRALGLSIENARQFGQHDTYLEGVAADRYGSLTVGGAPDAVFRPELMVRADLAPVVWRYGDWSLQPRIDLGWARYRVGDVWHVSPGVDLALREDWLFGGRLINVLDELRKLRSGYALSALWRSAPWQLNAGWTDAPESSDGVTVRVKTVSVGAAWDITRDTTLRLTGAREMRDAYDRNDLTIAVTQRF